ncbi:MAG: VOC family protein [Fimbriimonadales bacterium]
MQNAPKIHAIGIVSANIERSLDFYSKLGLDTPKFDPNEDHFHCDLGDGLFLMWDTVELVTQFMPNYEHQAGGSIGLGFDCGAPHAVDEKYASLVAAGFESQATPWDAFWGQRYAIVKDPDGNSISIYAAL